MATLSLSSDISANDSNEGPPCSEKLLRFIDLLHGCPTTKVALARISPGGKFNQSIIPIERLIPEAARLLGEQQCYIGLHPVYTQAKGRKADDVAALNGYFVDLDLYRITPENDPENLDLLRRCQIGSQETVVDAVLHFMRDHDVPEPSLVVFTGRGFQLLWLTEPQLLPQKSNERDRIIGKWALIQNALGKLLLPFGADKAALKLTQVIRLPETVNAKSGRKARVLRASIDRLDVGRFDHLLDPAALRTMNQAFSAKRRRRRSRDLPERMRVVRQTRAEIEDFLGWRHPDGLSEGCAQRHSAVHTMARAYRYSSRPDRWEKDALEWAVHNTDLPEKQVQSIIRSLRVNPGGFSPKTAARVLSVTKEIADERNYIRLRPTALSVDQKRARNTELRRLRRWEQGVKQRRPSVIEQIAKVAGVSRSKLYRDTTADQRSAASDLWREDQPSEALGLLKLNSAGKFDRTETKTSFPIRSRDTEGINKEGHISPITTDRFPPLHEYLGMSQRSLRRRPRKLREEAEVIYQQTGELPQSFADALAPRKPGRPRTEGTKNRVYPGDFNDRASTSDSCAKPNGVHGSMSMNDLDRQSYA